MNGIKKNEIWDICRFIIYYNLQNCGLLNDAQACVCMCVYVWLIHCKTNEYFDWSCIIYFTFAVCFHLWVYCIWLIMFYLLNKSIDILKFVINIQQYSLKSFKVFNYSSRNCCKINVFFTYFGRYVSSLHTSVFAYSLTLAPNCQVETANISLVGLPSLCEGRVIH